MTRTTKRGLFSAVPYRPWAGARAGAPSRANAERSDQKCAFPELCSGRPARCFSINISIPIPILIPYFYLYLYPYLSISLANSPLPSVYLASLHLPSLSHSFFLLPPFFSSSISPLHSLLFPFFLLAPLSPFS